MTEASLLEREIAHYFQFDTHIELFIRLDRCVPPIDRDVASEVVTRARTAGFLAQCIGERLIVKCPSRFRNRPVEHSSALRRTLLR